MTDAEGAVGTRLVTLKELQGNAASLIEELIASDQSAIIVLHGKLLAVLSPISGDDMLHEAFGKLAQELPDGGKIEEDRRSSQLAAIDVISQLDLIPEGYCTCNGASGSGRMRDCGIAEHRAEAERERQQPSGA